MKERVIMKFKVGDKVRVRNDLIVHQKYGALMFTMGMERYRGKIVTVTQRYIFPEPNCSYRIEQDGGNCLFSEEMFEPSKLNFTKSSLKDGMVVEYRNGKRRMVLGDKFIGEHHYLLINDFNDSLENNYIPDSVDKVYKSYASTLFEYFDDENLELIWERNLAKKMTIAEIEKELGYKVEIVDNKEK